MHLSAIYRYPVKSLGGEALAVGELEVRGLRDDRRWMFVDRDGQFITQRTCRRLARYRARTVGEQGLSIEYAADGGPVCTIERARPQAAPAIDVTLWDDRFAATEVPVANLRELTYELGIPGARLVYMNRAARRPVDPRYARSGEEVSFADGYPYLLVTDASLERASLRFGESLDVLRFRPNLVLAGVAEPFEEYAWDELRIGRNAFYAPKPCARCNVVTHEPRTGEVNTNVLRTLATFPRRADRKVLFGVNACWRSGSGELKVGDELTVTSTLPDGELSGK